MEFKLLQTRLVSHLRARVQNGHASERGLARLAGVSQPHIHHVLKGSRLLSMEMADQILLRLRINLMDLLTSEESGASRPADSGECRPVPMLEGWIGREHPYPQVVGLGRYPFPTPDVDRLESPIAVRLAPDPFRAAIFSGHGVVLLDRSKEVRCHPDEEGYFALDLSGGGTIGMVRRVGQRLCLWVRYADEWQSIALPDRDPLDLIQGRVSMVTRRL